jgi:hypothetical protein
MSSLRSIAVASAALVALSTGIASAQVLVQPPASGTVVIAPSAPPPPRAEVIPPPPDAIAQWQPGHWGWDGARWVWIAGRFEIPPAEAQTSGWHWIPGQWVQRADGSWVWSGGHWG